MSPATPSHCQADSPRHMGPSTCDEISETMNLLETVAVKELVTVTCVPCGSSKLTPSTFTAQQKGKVFSQGEKVPMRRSLHSSSVQELVCLNHSFVLEMVQDGDISHCDLESLD